LPRQGINFAIFATLIVWRGLKKRANNAKPRCTGVRAMPEGDAAYAMAVESAAIAVAACDLRLRRQLSEAFSEAIDLRGGSLDGGLCLQSDVIAVLEDVFKRVVDLYAEDLVPAREYVLRERAEALLRKILAEISTDFFVDWPFPEQNGDGAT
jgi:hypothetical protein